MLEWAAAVADEYRTKGSNVILGPGVNVHRVARGGCWADGIRVIRPANRAYQLPNHESNTIGFRLAQTLSLEIK